jgi:hypothetical protein
MGFLRSLDEKKKKKKTTKAGGRCCGRGKQHHPGCLPSFVLSFGRPYGTTPTQAQRSSDPSIHRSAGPSAASILAHRTAPWREDEEDRSRSDGTATAGNSKGGAALAVLAVVGGVA